MLQASTSPGCSSTTPRANTAGGERRGPCSATSNSTGSRNASRRSATCRRPRESSWPTNSVSQKHRSVYPRILHRFICKHRPVHAHILHRLICKHRPVHPRILHRFICKHRPVHPRILHRFICKHRPVHPRILHRFICKHSSVHPRILHRFMYVHT